MFGVCSFMSDATNHFNSIILLPVVTITGYRVLNRNPSIAERR